MDIVILSFAVILPLLVFSYQRAARREYQLHKQVQIWLALVLGVAVVLFEVDLRLSGGIFALTAGSRFAGSALLNGSIYFHTILAILTAVLWVWLIVASLKRFPAPPRPGAFSRAHRRFGNLGMWAMGLTGLTGIELYILGFVY